MPRLTHNCAGHTTMGHEFGHTNTFVNLNGIPYVLAEYIDRNKITQIDRSYIKSDLFIDQSESMRTIIDISIDDIGRRASDNLPAIIGNTTKQKNLIRMINLNADSLDHELDVLRRGIILRVDYQLESARTGNVIRSMTEDLRILDRNYFLDINPRDVDDNAIIVNFSKSMVSTVNEFTYGREKMQLRITGIHMFYECTKRSPKLTRIKDSLQTAPDMYLPGAFGGHHDSYNYHYEMQNHHVMGRCHYDDGYPEDITPPGWSMFNRFYHFDEGGRTLILHEQEINDPMSRVTYVPCGTVRVNRVFMINPCHRLVFKFSIWKNDVTFVNNTAPIAHALKALMMDGCHCSHDDFEFTDPDCNCGVHNPVIDPDHETVMRTMDMLRRNDIHQNRAIGQLIECIKELQDTVRSLIPKEDPNNPVEGDEPPIVVEPSNPVEDDTTGTSSVSAFQCNCSDMHNDINQQLDAIKTVLDDINDDEPIPTDSLKTMVDDAFGE